jgi:hypothetical protein
VDLFNPAWGVLFGIVQFALFLACYRLFGRTGLYAWVGVATVLANLQVVKTIEMLGLVMTLGNITYASIYMATDLLNERHGREEARRAVWFGFFFLFASTLVMQLALVFEPDESGLEMQAAMETVFGLAPRVAAGSLAAYLISQVLDVRLFSRLRRRFAARGQFWIRILGSTLVSQFVDTLVFCTVAFAGVFETVVWIDILVTTYLIKFVVSGAGTPVLYIARSFRDEEGWWMWRKAAGKAD